MEQNLKPSSVHAPTLQTHKLRKQNKSNKWMSKLLRHSQEKTLWLNCSRYSTDWFYFVLLQKVNVVFTKKKKIKRIKNTKDTIHVTAFLLGED